MLGAITDRDYVFGNHCEWLWLGPSLGVVKAGAISENFYGCGHRWAWLSLGPSLRMVMAGAISGRG